MRCESELWLKSAEENLDDARTFMKSGRYFRTAFFAQQCVEKVLKALFIELAREEPPKTYSITDLYRNLAEIAEFRLKTDPEDQIFILNKYYTVSRYPDAANGLPSKSVDRVEAKRALRISEEILKYARSFVGDKTKS